MNVLRKLQNILFIAFIISIIIAAIGYLLWGSSIPVETIRTYIDNFGVWSPIVFIALYVITTIFIPSTFLMVLAGILFGFLNGFIYTSIAGIISATLVFAISRKLGTSFVEKFLQHEKLEKINQYNEKISRHGMWSLIILRIMPIMPFNVLNILMGISKITTRNYIMGTLIGLVPSHLISVYLGNVITKII